MLQAPAESRDSVFGFAVVSPTGDQVILSAEDETTQRVWMEEIRFNSRLVRRETLPLPLMSVCSVVFICHTYVWIHRSDS